MLRRWFKRIAWASLALVMLVVAFGVHTWYFKPVSLELFYGRVFAKYALQDPEMLSSMRLLEGLGLRFHNNDLTQAGPERDIAVQAQLKADLATLRSYDRAALASKQQLSYDVLEFFLSMQDRMAAFSLHNYPVNQLFGVQNGFPRFMNETHQINDARDAEDFVARLNKVLGKFSGVLDGLKLRESKGIIPPRFVVEKVLAEMRAFAITPAQDNTLYVEYAKKLEKLDASVLPNEQKAALLNDAKQAIESSVYPAYQSLISYYDGLLAKTNGNNGVWALPDGDAFYTLAIEQQTTTKMSADQIHSIGLAEVARIAQEMDAILDVAGYVDGTLAERVQQLSQSPEQLYPDTDAGREQILADYKQMIDEIDKGLAPAFDIRPKAGIEVRRVPPFAEKTAPGAYYNAPAMDGSRPGVFYANLRDVKETPKFSMRTLAYHEGVPGHHFQIAIMRELKGVPFFRRVLPFTAFSEGWALYTEQLAWEMGFQANPLDNLGRLQAEMFRAVRLVVDTGLHHQRWTREQGIAYMIEKTGMAEGEVVSEIERYLVMPGQALAYKVGMLKILELRERAKQRMGARFTLPEFHNQVLTNGSLPLVLLERVIDTWSSAP